MIHPLTPPEEQLGLAASPSGRRCQPPGGATRFATALGSRTIRI